MRAIIAIVMGMLQSRQLIKEPRPAKPSGSAFCASALYCPWRHSVLTQLIFTAAQPATQPASTISKNAPPTPPETQHTSETKAPQPAADLPPIVSEPLKTAEAPLVPAPVAQPETAPVAPVAASEPPKDAESKASDAEQKPAEAEKPAAEPEKPSESATVPDAQPVSAEASVAPVAAPSETENKPPKPVSVEEVRDAEMPPAKPLEADESAKTEDSTVKPAVPAPEEKKDVEMTDAVPAAAEVANTEPQTGDKRKAEEAGDVNGAVAEEAPPADIPALKKQKSKGSASNGTEKKPGRPKKEKKAAPVVGKTARRTRSQAALDEA
jgi:hypothetical protein